MCHRQEIRYHGSLSRFKVDASSIKWESRSLFIILFVYFPLIDVSIIVFYPSLFIKFNRWDLKLHLIIFILISITIFNLQFFYTFVFLLFDNFANFQRLIAAISLFHVTLNLLNFPNPIIPSNFLNPSFLSFLLTHPANFSP